MIKFLVTQVLLGRITLEQIPEKYRAAVQAALKEVNV
jgi:hypothetical protein